MFYYLNLCQSLISEISFLFKIVFNGPRQNPQMDHKALFPRQVPIPS